MSEAALFQSILASLPEIVVIAGACVLLILGEFVRKGQEHLLVWASVAIVLLAALGTLMLAGEVQPAYSGMFVADRFAVFFKVVFYLATVLTFLLSRKYAEIEGIESSEYYVLLLFALSGMMIMASATDLLSVYVGLELMALCTYVLTGFLRQQRRSNEAALKYVILGGVSTGIFLYGVSLVYGLTGTTQLDGMAAAVTGGPLDPGLLLAVVFIVAGLVFKVGAVPFHMWVPDVYHGAPTPVTLFIGSAPKIASFVLAFRVLAEGLDAMVGSWQDMLIALAVLSMIIGNVVAIAQTNLKRMLAYSTISHVGFIFLGILAGTNEGYRAAMYYTLAYVIMTIGSFGMILLMSREGFEAWR